MTQSFGSAQQKKIRILRDLFLLEEKIERCVSVILWWILFSPSTRVWEGTHVDHYFDDVGVLEAIKPYYYYVGHRIPDLSLTDN